MPTRHQTHSAHNLQHRHLGLDVLCGQALSDNVDALGMREDMGAALRVVHQRFDAADERRVDLRLCCLVVHALQEVQDARQAVKVDKASHEPERRTHKEKISLVTNTYEF